MRSRILSKKELRDIEQEIDEINSIAEHLDPSDPIESEQLYFCDMRLSIYLDALESSHKKARIKDIGLMIVR